MFRIKSPVAFCAVLGALGLGSHVSALPLDSVSAGQIYVGSCKMAGRAISRFSLPGDAVIWFLNKGGSVVGTAGGASWASGVLSPAPAVTDQSVSDCDLVGARVVSQSGANAVSYTAQGEMNLVVRAQDNLGGVLKEYSMVIGANGVVLGQEPVISSAPLAHAGDDPTVASAAPVTLDASGSSDADGTVATYAWSQTSGTPVTLSSTSAANPTFTAPAVDINDSAKTLVFSLTVTDNDGAISTADTVTVTVNPRVNAIPTANAGADQTVASAAPVMLDASGSSDTDGTIATYAWSQTSGTPVALSSTSAASPTFTAPTLTSGESAQTLVFSLTVTDNDGGTSAADTVTIVVQSPGDTTPPEAPTTANTSLTSNPDGSVTVSGTTEPGATVRVTFPDGSVGTVVAGANGTYTIRSRPNQPDSYVSVQVTDPAGNVSSALRLTYVAGPSVEEIQTEVAGYMQARASLVTQAQPDLIGLLPGNVAGAFNAFVTGGQGRFNFVTSGSQPVWARIQGNWSETGDNKNSYFFGVVGGHVKLSPDAIAGVMLQFDKLTQKNGDTTTEGDGYLVGPYFVAKLPEQPLYFEGRYLIGQTENSVSVDGAAAEDFDTDRTLVSVKVAGQLYYGDLTLTPSLSATRLKDTQKAFTDSAGRAVAKQGITTTDVAAGLDFSKPLAVDSGTLVLTGGLSGIWSETSGSGFAQGLTSDFEGTRGRVHLGTTYTMHNGMTWAIGASYDGIGADDYESFGLNVGFEMKF